MWLPILLFHLLYTFVSSVPPLTPFTGINPKCFPTRPHCIRPRVEECRDAIYLIGVADPGYPVILGRSEAIDHVPHAFEVPYMWSSLPINCIVKIDVTDPTATEEVSLKALAGMSEVLVRKCIIGGTGCGGSVLVGKAGKLRLSVSYYTQVDRANGILVWHSNVTRSVDDVG
ncbi:MAG: hypothetical protein Q9208_002631 [Pyrenodesmia sp. 3 TL-2023]